MVSVDAALAKVRATKAFGGSMPSTGPLNETKVLRAIVDDYLSHSRLADDLPPVSGRICDRDSSGSHSQPMSHKR